MGSAENSLSQPADNVQISSQAVGSIVTQANRSRFMRNSTAVPSISAIAASIWFEMPNTGHKVFTPPSGSVTP